MGFFSKKIGGVVRSAMNPENYLLRFSCICGQTLGVPQALSGRRGHCPACDRPLRVPGALSTNSRPVVTQNHMMRNIKANLLEPNFSPDDSDYYGAQLHTFLMGAIPLVIWSAFLAVIVRANPQVLETFGAERFPAWARATWLLGYLLITCCCSIPVAQLYRRYTGYGYSDDRYGYAHAGGYDIVRIAPLLALLVAAASFTLAAHVLPATLLGSLRNPWLFGALAVALSYLLAWLSAHRVFRCALRKRSLTFILRGV